MRRPPDPRVVGYLAIAPRCVVGYHAAMKKQHPSDARDRSAYHAAYYRKHKEKIAAENRRLATAPDSDVLSTERQARFWAKVDKSGECWTWTSTRDKSGYATYRFNGRTHKAYRVAWALANGRIPGGAHVLHSCDNPPCVRPDHLFLGSHADNMADASAKLRMHPGSAHGMAKLTESDVLEMRRLFEKGNSQAVIARAYGVSPGHVSEIIARKLWRHI